MKTQSDNVRYGPASSSPHQTSEAQRRFHTQACGVPAEPLREIPAGGIVKWTDKNGIIHYEDFHGKTQPEGKSLVTRFPHTKDYFSLEITLPPDSRLPFSKKDIQQQATQAYEVYRTWLDDRWLSRAEIRLLFYTDEQQYAAHRDKYVGKDADDVLGFYILPLNQAVILHSGSRDATLGIMVHEVAHIINNQVFGEIPRWLNEGLATHIGQLKSDGSGTTLTGQRLKNIKAYTKNRVTSSISVDELLSATHNDWLPDKRAAYYQLSQMVTFFLLLPENRNFTIPMLNLLAEKKCSEGNLNSVIEERYRGGISGLSDDFNRWLDK